MKYFIKCFWQPERLRDFDERSCQSKRDRYYDQNQRRYKALPQRIFELPPLLQLAFRLPGGSLGLHDSERRPRDLQEKYADKLTVEASHCAPLRAGDRLRGSRIQAVFEETLPNSRLSK